VNTSNELILAQCLATIRRLQPFGFCLECTQVLAEVDLGDVHDDIKKRNSRTRVCDGLNLIGISPFDGDGESYLVGKPHIIWTLGELLRFFIVFVPVSEEEYQSIDWLPSKQSICIRENG
jgi:hypothetical protein